MTAALGTLPFLATIWLLVVVGASVLEESGAKIAAALKGKPLHQSGSGPRRIRIRMRQPLQPMRAEACRLAAA